MIADVQLEAQRRIVQGRVSGQRLNELRAYRFDAQNYIVNELGWQPWAGDSDHPGQVEILHAYELALRQQHERLAYENGEVDGRELEHWQPGQVIQNRIRVEAGHTVGKTKLAAGLVSHFFDTCTPSIIYSFAPGYDQVNDLLWKEIRTDRRNRNLPGRVLETPELKYKGSHFAKGRATDNANGKGTERVQGQHGKYLMFVIDEAEGVADFVYDAVESMSSGGIIIILMLANPRTRVSRFYKQRTRTDVANFRISCLWHPNVLADREIVPGAVRRDYVTKMLDHCEVVEEHNPDNHTFELPWQPGVIYLPDTEYLFRVLGIAPSNSAIDTFVPVGRYEAATKREPNPSNDENAWATMGIDCARYGDDMGNLYIRHNAQVWRAAQFAKLDSFAYYMRVKDEAERLKEKGVKRLSVRVDAGGGFGSGVTDLLNHDADVTTWFEDFRVDEVHFNGSAADPNAYADCAANMYGEAAETLKGIAVLNPPEMLESDLTERRYKWVNKSGKNVKQLEQKPDFRKRHGRSPDDGDGFVLAIAPDHVIQQNWWVA